MKRFISIISVLVIAIAAMVVFTRTFNAAVIGTSETEIASPPNAILQMNYSVPTNSPALQVRSAVIPPSYPARLTIPSLKIYARVQEVGINTKGAISSPSNFTDVGWYKYGTVPGEMGNALIDGHVDNGLALAGVFKHISDIQVNDHIFITTQGGKKLDFVVTSVNSYDYEHVPLKEILTAHDST